MFSNDVDDNDEATLSAAMEGMMRNDIVLDHKNPWNTLNSDSFFPFQIEKQVTKTIENGVERYQSVTMHKIYFNCLDPNDMFYNL